jgi:nitroreductase
MVDIDTAIATDHMMMEALSLGLGTCWLTYFDPKVVRRAFNIPGRLEAVHILVAGYAASEPPSPERYAKDRKPLKDFVTYGSY